MPAHEALATQMDLVRKRAALASECADDQGAFFTYAEDVFATSVPDWEGDAELLALARDTDLDQDTFMRCLETAEHEDRVDDDTLQALATGATGAPWSILVDSNGHILMRFKGAIGKKRLNEALQMALDDQKENE